MRGVAGFGEGLFQIVRRLAVVLDNKNLHAILIRGIGCLLRLDQHRRRSEMSCGSRRWGLLPQEPCAGTDNTPSSITSGRPASGVWAGRAGSDRLEQDQVIPLHDLARKSASFRCADLRFGIVLQLFATGRATKRLSLSREICTRTDFLPVLAAAAIAFSKSLAPLISVAFTARMMSPACRPRSSAGLPGSTSVTTTP